MRIEIHNFAQYEGETFYEAYQLLEDMALNNCQWLSERATPKKLSGVHELDVFNNLDVQVSLLTKQLQSTQLQMPKLWQV